MAWSFKLKRKCLPCSHLQEMQRLLFLEHAELDKLADETDGFQLGLDVNLILLTHLKRENGGTKMSRDI